MVVCPFCKRETQLMRGPDGYAVCPLCHNNPPKAPAKKAAPKAPAKTAAKSAGKPKVAAPPPEPVGEGEPEPEVVVTRQWKPTPQPAWTPSAPTKPEKSATTAGVLSFFFPGVGQFYAGDKKGGWSFLAAWILVIILAFTLSFTGVIGLVLAIWASNNAIKAANRINAANGYPPRKEKSTKWVLIIFGVIIGAIILSAVVFVLVSNLSTEELDTAKLTPDPGSNVILNSQTFTVLANQYQRQDLTLSSSQAMTLSFVSPDHENLDICLAYPSNEAAFAANTQVDCFILFNDAIQGKKTVSLPAGSYSIFMTGSTGQAATFQVSAWSQ